MEVQLISLTFKDTTLNNFFADNYVEEGSSTGLYFPADVNQMDAIIKRIFNDHGLRFVFSNSKTRISKKSKTTYAMWCEKHGFKYADGFIRKGWIKELN